MRIASRATRVCRPVKPKASQAASRGLLKPMRRTGEDHDLARRRRCRVAYGAGQDPTVGAGGQGVGAERHFGISAVDQFDDRGLRARAVGDPIQQRLVQNQFRLQGREGGARREDTSFPIHQRRGQALLAERALGSPAARTCADRQEGFR